MTEAEWLTCADPLQMLEFLRGKASERKLRLFAVACCRRVQHLLVPEAREALEVAEQFAEGCAGPEDRRRMRERAFHFDWHSDRATAHRRGPAKAAVCDALSRQGWRAAEGAVWRAIHVGSLESYSTIGNWDASRNGQCGFFAELLRCVMGNPFRPRLAGPAWADNPAAKTKAREIYEGRTFDRMPELADALEVAGCRDEDILNHCRGSGPHARGCWVVDLLLRQS